MEDDYFKAKREYKKDLENKVFEDLEKEAKKMKRRRKEVGRDDDYDLLYRICDHNDLHCSHKTTESSKNLFLEGETEGEFIRSLAEEAALKKIKKKELRKKLAKRKQRGESIYPNVMQCRFCDGAALDGLRFLGVRLK